MAFPLTDDEKQILRDSHTLLKNLGHTDAMQAIGKVLEYDEQERIRKIKPNPTNHLTDSGGAAHKYWLWVSDTTGAQYRHQNCVWWLRMLGDVQDSEEAWTLTTPAHALLAKHGELFIPIVYLGA